MPAAAGLTRLPALSRCCLPLCPSQLPQLSSLTPAPLQQPTPSQAQPLFLQCDSPFYLPPLPGLPKPQQAPQAVSALAWVI